MKSGQFLHVAIEKQNKRCKSPLPNPEEITYNSPKDLFLKKIQKIPHDLSLAMQEYYKSRYFSSELESKKQQNLENFFIVIEN